MSEFDPFEGRSSDYGNYSQSETDCLTQYLCSAMSVIEAANLLRNVSVKCRRWWTDEKKRCRQAIQEADASEKKRKDRKKAISKLSKYERRLLGL